MNQKTNGQKHDNPFLVIQEGYGQNREFVLERNNAVIGRDPDCEIVTGDRNVSRHHATISREQEGFIIKDLSSANGTFVNSQPIVTQCLKHLDIIQIGGVMMVFNDPDTPSYNHTETKWADFTEESLNFDKLRQVIRQLETNIETVFKGNPDVVRNLIVCLMADGHMLLEDAPGVGKSLLAQTLAKSVQAQYRRIQFTPDMLPSDITGTNMYDEATGTFRFLPGPIFGNVILADEINRTTPRTQSSLLECMSESSVTIDGKSHVLPKPFFVIATQNPEDYHGTYPLPEPQLDRFLMCLHIGYPNPKAEMEILESQLTSHPLNSISYVIKSNDVVYCQALVRKVKVSAQIKDFIIRISNATREHPALVNGCSPRASLAVMRSCQSLAAYNGRDYVTPKDVRDMLKLVISHRLRLKLRCRTEWKSVEHVLETILSSIKLKNEEVS
ncbi:MAG: Glycogen accumulation regulator GarA [Lentisphaerae bacterium ADurb.Bin242]|nr:MAG: Glycogen accumulation regulator GarA [Lentisphaerae bacterium ADurb.Bin242]